MTKRHGKRIAIWIPDTLADRIEAARDWRTTSEYIRMLIDEGLPKPGKVKAPKSAKPDNSPATETEAQQIYREAYGDDKQWDFQVSAHESVEAAIAASMQEPVFVQKLAALRAKSPAV